MGNAEKIRPVSYLEAHAAEMLRTIGEDAAPVIITQNWEAKVVLRDLASLGRTQQTLALLKLLTLGAQNVAAGRTMPAREAIDRVRRRDRAA